MQRRGEGKNVWFGDLLTVLPGGCSFFGTSRLFRCATKVRGRALNQLKPLSARSLKAIPELPAPKVAELAAD